MEPLGELPLKQESLQQLNVSTHFIFGWGGLGTLKHPIKHMRPLRDDYNYAYISTATTTQVATGGGRLIRIILGETAAGAISLIDNTAGTTANIGVLKASIVEGTYEFGVNFAAGLRIVTAGASKLTVVYATN